MDQFYGIIEHEYYYNDGKTHPADSFFPVSHVIRFGHIDRIVFILLDAFHDISPSYKHVYMPWHNLFSVFCGTSLPTA
jgi:hypothetical protein